MIIEVIQGGFCEVTWVTDDDEAYVHVDAGGTVIDLYMHHDSDWIESTFVAGVSRWRNGKNQLFSHAEKPTEVLAYLKKNGWTKEEGLDAE